MIVVLAILLIIIGVLVIRNIVIVPQGYAFVLERLGKYSCTWQAGLHLKMPFIERIVKKISLKEQVLDFPPQKVITRDNVQIDLDSVIYTTVFNPKLYTYGVENPIAGLQNLCATTLRNVAGEMELDQLLSSRDSINHNLTKVIDEATDKWGLRISRVELKQIGVDPQLQAIMSKQMRAERERRQTVLEAQAHQEAVVARAEGDKKAKVLAAEAERDAQIALAEGKAKSIEMVYEAEAEGLAALNNAKISEAVLRLKGIEALKDVADGRATKIFVPTDITNTVSSLGVIGETLGIGSTVPVDDSEKEKPEPKADPCVKPTTSRAGKEAAQKIQELDAVMCEQFEV